MTWFTDFDALVITSDIGVGVVAYLIARRRTNTRTAVLCGLGFGCLWPALVIAFVLAIFFGVQIRVTDPESPGKTKRRRAR